MKICHVMLSTIVIICLFIPITNNQNEYSLLNEFKNINESPCFLSNDILLQNQLQYNETFGHHFYAGHDQNFLNYVWLRDKIYIHPSYPQWPAPRLYHSCLSHGWPVKAAGRIKFVSSSSALNDTRQKIYWDNTSGHYRPGKQSLLRLVNFFNLQNSDKEQHIFRIHSSNRCNFIFCTHYMYELTLEQLERFVHIENMNTIQWLFYELEFFHHFTLDIVPDF